MERNEHIRLNYTQSRKHLSAYPQPSAGYESLSGRKHRPDCNTLGWLLSLRSAFWRTPEARSSENLSLLWTVHHLASSLMPLDWQGWVWRDRCLLEFNRPESKWNKEHLPIQLLSVTTGVIPAVIKNGDDSRRSLSSFLTEQRSHFRSWKRHQCIFLWLQCHFHSGKK